MTKGWTSAEHVGKITISILDILSKEFHKQSKKSEEEKDYNLMIKLSQAGGYQAQLYVGLQKSIEYAKRLEDLEKTVIHASAETLAMGNSPVLAEEAELKSREQNR